VSETRKYYVSRTRMWHLPRIVRQDNGTIPVDLPVELAERYRLICREAVKIMRQVEKAEAVAIGEVSLERRVELTGFGRG
jgi:hypothetical protein